MIKSILIDMSYGLKKGSKESSLGTIKLFLLNLRISIAILLPLRLMNMLTSQSLIIVQGTLMSYSIKSAVEFIKEDISRREDWTPEYIGGYIIGSILTGMFLTGLGIDILIVVLYGALRLMYRLVK